MMVIEVDEVIKKRIQTIKDNVLTPERQRDADVRLNIDSGRGGFNIEVAQIPLDRYLRRKNISLGEYRAGERLHRDFYESGQTVALTVNLNAMPSAQRKAYLPASDRQREALDSWRKAMAPIQGKMGQLMVLNVCCYGYWLSDINYSPYTEKQAMPRFREALEYLIEHYKNIT